MATNILFKRGLNSSFQAVTLKSGEPAFITDIGKLYIGDGSKKVLINPIDKPIGINTTNYYAKIKVNEYGQVNGQTTLSPQDIPVIPTTQISGLGSAAVINAGTSAGNVPVLDSSGKLLDTVMPISFNKGYAFAYYSGNNGQLVNPNQFVPLNNFNSSSQMFTIENGIISINQIGVYLISYNITSSTIQLATCLAYSTFTAWTGTSMRSTSTAVPPYTSTCSTIVRQVTTVPEKFGIKNIGTLDISLLTGHGCISIAKVG